MNATQFKIFFVLSFIYCLHVVPGGGINANRYLDLTYSLADKGMVFIDDYHENTIDKALKDGHYISAGLPGPSLWAIASYEIFKNVSHLLPQPIKNKFRIASYFTPPKKTIFDPTRPDYYFFSAIWITCFSLSLLSAFGSAVLFDLLCDLGTLPRGALIATLAYALATPVFYFSTTYFSHVITATLLIFFFKLLASSESKGPAFMFFAGLAAGATILSEYYGLVIIVCGAAYVFAKRGWSGLFYYSLGVGLCSPALLIYNLEALGGILKVPHSYLVGDNRIKVHGVGLLGFTLPHRRRLYGLLFSSARGIFVYSPILLLGVWGWWVKFRKKDLYQTFIVLAAGISFLIFIWVACYQDWRGGASFGPRQLILLMPALAAGLGFGLSVTPKKIWVPLLIWSVIVNWLGAQYGFAEKVLEHFYAIPQKGFMPPIVRPLINQGGNFSFMVSAVYLCLMFLLFALFADEFKRSSS